MLIFLGYTPFPSLKTKQSWQKTLSRLSRCHTYKVSELSQLGKFCSLTGQQFLDSYPRVYQQLREICNIVGKIEIVNKIQKKEIREANKINFPNCRKSSYLPSFCSSRYHFEYST